jgi:hypothetical protein
MKETLLDICGYSWIIARNRIEIIEENESHCVLTEKKMNYLTIKAFVRILKQKQTKYSEFISWMESILYSMNSDIKNELEKVTEDVHSQDLFKIQF